MRLHVLGLLVIVLMGSACASSHVIVGQTRPAISPEQVKIYVDPPAKYEKIAILEASSKNSWTITSQGKTNKVIERLKTEAASLGANGILLQNLGEQYGGSVNTGSASVQSSGTGAYGTGVGTSIPTMHKTGSALAIYVDTTSSPQQLLLSLKRDLRTTSIVYEHTPAELRRHLEEELVFLRASADAFDAGNESEAKRLALSIRKLVHDTGKSQSLLGLLGEKDRKWYDSATGDVSGNLLGHSALVETFMPTGGGVPKMIPLLDDELPGVKPTWSSFAEWWNRRIFRTSSGHELSRRDLILSIADQDGGAHIDRQLDDESYVAISRENALRMEFATGTASGTIRAPELAACRQIAHEVLKTFMPDYVKKPDPGPGIILGGSVLVVGDGPDSIPAESRPPTIVKAGRNDPCPCGSGKKYKKCHARQITGGAGDQCAAYTRRLKIKP